MSTNIGIGLTSNYKKKVNSMVINSYALTQKETNFSENIVEFLNSETLRNKVLTIIQSLGSGTESLDEDENPLDNIIKEEIVNFLNYRRISKVKIQNAIALITEGQEPYSIFDADESLIILNQARQLEYISEQDYINILPSPNTLYANKPTVYKDVLDFQLSLPNNIPTIDELKIAGIVNFILDTVRDNPEVVVDEDLVKYYTETYIDEVLLTTEFIGYQKSTEILSDPEYILGILGKIGFQNLITRVRPYLPFITQKKVDMVMDYIPSQYRNITDVFSKEQIRMMIDKELDIKNLILKTLTHTEIQTVFNELTAQFKIDFADAFTEEKLLELIVLAIDMVYPTLSNEQIYAELCEYIGVNVNTIPIPRIENYLNSRQDP